ncbi:MAG: 4-hydroxy-tetrahydrodipicolinate reductase [Planctomycetaceae bacterium]|nr:4-hydroxy-tetrahydrodipicolinate reductase [Planctomycetaceae bacterium]
MASQKEPTRVVIHGAAGRMGRRLIALGANDNAMQIVGAIESSTHPDQGRDAGELAGIGTLGIPIRSELPETAEAVIDFSTAEAVSGIVSACQAQSVALVLATTGLTAAVDEQVNAAGKVIPIVRAPNMSLAVNLTMKLATIAAQKLASYGPGADVEIIERHHRYKEDSPSGTALRFGELIAAEMGQDQHVHGREGRPGARPQNEIGYHALRTGDNPGEHTIVFGLLGETVELSVKATNRDCYALGALEAAKFIAAQKPGFYSMNDVLQL